MLTKRSRTGVSSRHFSPAFIRRLSSWLALSTSLVVVLAVRGETINVDRLFVDEQVGPLTGPDFTKRGFGEFRIMNNQSGITGAVILERGILRLKSDDLGILSFAPYVPSLSAAASYTINQGSDLIVDHSTNGLPGYTLPNSLSDTAPITLNGGRLSFLSPNLAGNGTYTETVGNLVLGTGHSSVLVSQTNTASAAELSFGNLSRTAASQVINFLKGTNGTLGATGNNPRIFIANGASFNNDGLMGGWALANTTDFATYGANGVAVAAATSTDLTTAGATDYVSITATPGASITTKTINALKLNGSITVTIAASNTLTIDTGGLIAISANDKTITGGTLTSGADALYLHINQNTLTLNSLITDGAGTFSLVKTLGGAVTLSGGADNTYDGGTTILGGTITTGSTANRRYLGTGSVEVVRGQLTLGAAGAIAAASSATGVTVRSGSQVHLNVGTGVYTATGDNFTIEADAVISGSVTAANQGLNSVSRVATITGGGQVVLAENAIVGHGTVLTGALNLTTGTIKNLGTSADLFFGTITTQNNAGGSITIGTGTAFKGVSTDRTSRNWQLGTINIAAGTTDIYLQGLTYPDTVGNGVTAATLTLGNGATAGAPVIASAVGVGGVKVHIRQGQVTLNDSGTTWGDDANPISLIVDGGALLEAQQATSFSRAVGSTGTAALSVAGGGTLQQIATSGQGAENAFNNNVTIQAGGRFIARLTEGLTGTGSFTFASDAILQIDNVVGWSGAQALAATNVNGAIVRLNVDLYGTAAAPLLTTAFNGSGRYIVTGGNRGAANPTAANTSILTLNGGFISNDASDRNWNASTNGFIDVAAGGGTIAGTTGTFLAILEDIQLHNRTLTIGSATAVDGYGKLGEVRLTTVTADPGAQIVITGGALLRPTGTLDDDITVTIGNGGAYFVDTTDTFVTNFLGSGGQIIGDSVVTISLGAADYTLAHGLGAPSSGVSSTLFGLTKAGAGKLTYTGVSVAGNAGSLQINEGIFELSSGSSLGNGLALKLVAANGVTATVDLTNTTQTVSSVAMSGGSATSATVLAGSGGTLNLAGNLSYSGTNNPAGGIVSVSNLNLQGADRTFTVTDTTSAAFDLDVSSNLSNGGLIKAGNGVLNLTGNNTYTGVTSATAGILRLGSTTAVPGGLGTTGGLSGITINGGLLGLAVSDLSRGLGTGADQIQFTGSGGFIAYGADRMVNFGGAGAGITWGAGGFVPAGSTLILNHTSGTGTVEIANPIQLATTSGARTIQVDDGTAAFDGYLSGGLADSGTFGFIKTGAGRLRVGGPAYNGAWVLQGGVVVFDAVPTGNITLDGSVYTSNNTLEGGTFNRAVGTGAGQVQWTANGGGFSAEGGPLTVNLATAGLIWGGTTNFLTGAGPLIFGSASADNVVTWQNAINLNNTATTNVVRTIRVDDNTSSAVDFAALSGILSTSSGSVILTKTGTGILELRAANTYAGSTVINAGTLRLGTGGSLPSGGNLSVVSTLASNIATFDLGANNQTIGTLTVGGSLATNGAAITGTGTLTLGGDVTYDATGNNLGATVSANVNLGGVNRTFTVNNSTGVVNDVVVSGQISNGGLIKAGAGRLVLSNNSSTFSGPITLNAGELAFTSAGLVGGGASALGTPANATQGTITWVNGLLDFVGDTVSSTTDRNIDGLTATADLTIQANGTNGAVLTWNGNVTTDDRSLILQGSSDGIFGGTFTGTDGGGTATPDAYKRGTGTWTINGALNSEDDLFVEAGTLILNVADAFTADDILIRGNSILRVSAANGFRNVDELRIGNETTAGSATLDLLANASADDIFLGGNAGFIGNITGTGTLNAVLSGELRIGSIASGVTLTGAQIIKLGAGVVTLDGVINSNLAVIEGDMVLNYVTTNAEKLGGTLLLGSTNPNRLQGGRLVLNGNSSAPTVESVPATTIIPGAISVVINNGTGQTATLNLNAITRTAAGGTVRFIYSSNDAKATTTATNATLGYATVTLNGTRRIAVTDGDGNIGQAVGAVKNDVSTWLPGEQVINDAAFSNQVGNRSTAIASLTFEAAAASTVTIKPNRRLTITSGGILIDDTVGANASLITGGQLVGAAAAPLGEIIVHQENAAGTFEIASNIVNSAGLTKSGAGELIVSGTNTFAATSQLTINEGKVTMRGGNAIGDTTTVFMRQGTTLALEDDTAETIGKLSVDGTNMSNGTIAIGTGSTLTINQTGSASFSGVFTGGATSTLIKTGAGNLQLFGNSTGFTGQVIVNQGLFYISGSGGRLTGVTSFILNSGSTLMVDNDDDASPSTAGMRIGDTATITLNSTDGFFSSTSDFAPHGLAIRTDNNSGSNIETVGTINVASGASYVTMEASGGTSSVTGFVAATGINRTAGATLNIRGSALGTAATGLQRSSFKIANANDSAFMAANLVGGAGVSGGTAKNIKIVPWAMGESLGGDIGTNTNLGNTFLTYVDDRGFVPLDLVNEYRTFAAGGTVQDNVREVLTADLTGIAGQTINSLVLHDNTTAASALNLTGTGAGQTLINTSGAFLFTLNTAATAGSAHGIKVFGFDGGIQVGPTNEYLIFVVNPSTANGAAALTAELASPLNSTAASLVKSGKGTLLLSAANTYGGGTTINEGAIQISALNNLGTGGLTLAGGTLRLGSGFADDLSTRPITLTPTGGTLDTNGFSTVMANGLDMTGTGSFGKAGNGLLTVQGASTFTGLFIVGHSASATAATAGISHGVVLNGSGPTVNGNLQIGSTAVPTTGIAGVSLGADEQIVDTATVSFSGASSRWGYFKILGHQETIAGLSDSTASGVIENREGETVTSAGTLILNSNQDFAYNGYLRDNSGGTADVNPLNVVKQGSGTQTLSGVQIRYTGTTTVSGGTLNLLNTTIFASPIVNDATVIFDYTNGTALTLTRNISGSGDFVKRGTGTVEWNGTNTFIGAVAIEEGVLSFASSFGSNAVGNTISLHDSATLRSTGVANVLGANQAIDLGGNVANIEVTGAATNTLTVNGILSGGAATRFNKAGVGTLILAWANTYQGETTVTAGTLELRHASALGASSKLSLANGTAAVFNASALGGAASYSLSGTGSVVNLGTAGGTVSLGFGLNGATSDKLVFGVGQTFTVGGTGVLTDIYVNGPLTASTYTLIQSAAATSYGLFTLGTIFNPGAYVYNLDNTGPNNLVLNVTAVAAPTSAYWKGDLGGTGTGVWTAVNIGGNTNWATALDGLTDTQVVPDATSDIFFAATGAANFTTTLGGDLAIKSLTFLAGSGVGGSGTTVGGSNLLTVAGAGGITLASGAGNITLSTRIALGANQTWTVTDAADNLIVSGVVSGGSGFEKAGTGTVTLAADNTYSGTTTISGGTLQVGNNGTTGSLGAGDVVNNSQLVFNRSNTLVTAQNISGTGSVTKNAAGTLTLNGVNSYQGGTNLAAGVLVLGNKSALGTGVLNVTGAATLQAGADLTGANKVSNDVNLLATLTVTGTNNLEIGGVTTVNGASRSITSSLTGPAALTISGNIVLGESTGTPAARNLTVNGTGSTFITGSIQNGTVAGGWFVKGGTGTVTLGAPNTYTGFTIIDQGVLTLAAGVNQSMTNTFFFGSSNGATSAGTLDLSNASATFTASTALNAQINSAVNSPSIIVGAGQALNLNGNVIIGTGLGGSTNSLLSASGAGAINVTNATSGASFRVGGYTGTTAGQGNLVTADFSGLATLNVSLNTTNGTFAVASNSSANTTGKYATLILGTTTTVTAANLNVGDGGHYNTGGVGQVNSLKLGSGVTTFNVTNVNIGTGIRDFGSLTFNGASGTLKIRTAADPVNGRAALNIGTGGATTAVVLEAGVRNTFDVTGHDVDLLFGAVNIGTQAGRASSQDNLLAFNQGIMDMTGLTMSTHGANAFFTTSTVNIGGGTVNIGTGSGTAITMATAGTGSTATATINLTGGLTTVKGNILRGGGAGTATATLNLDGGTLNMSGKNIGAAGTTAISQLIFASGTLENVAAINGTAGLTKTTAGTLTLAGTNTWAGPTAVNEGKVVVAGSVSGVVNVAAGATLASGHNTSAAIGQLTAVSDAVSGSVVAVGDDGGPGLSTVGKLNVNGSVTLGTLGMQAAQLHLEIGGLAAGTQYDQLAILGGSTLNLTNVRLEGSLLNGFAPTQATFTGGLYNLDGDKFFLIVGAGSPITTTFANQGPMVMGLNTITLGGQQFAISYQASFSGGTFTGGNDVALMAIPEPASAALLLAAASAALGLTRLRRRRD